MQLTAEKLSIERGGRVIVAGLSFVARPGEAVILIGPNGAGKTTLLRTLAGFLPLSGGTLGVSGGTSDLSIGEQCHFIGHANAVKANLTVGENVRFWADYLGGHEGSAARSEAAMRQFDLLHLESFPAAYLSAGQRRRTGLARLIAANRPIWLLDEPTVSLDAASTKLLADAVDAHLQAGGLVIAATHLPLGFARSRELHLGGEQAAA